MGDMMDAIDDLVGTQLRMLAEFRAAGIGGLGGPLNHQITVAYMEHAERYAFMTRLRSMVEALDTLAQHAE